MSEHVLRTATIYAGNSSVDISGYVESVEFTVGVDNAEVTCFGDSYRQHVAGGLKRWSVRLNMFQGFGTSEAYDVLEACFSTGTTFPIFVKPYSDAVSSTNPAFSGSAVLDGDFGLVSGAVGEAHKTSVTLKGAGTLTFITTASA